MRAFPMDKLRTLLFNFLSSFLLLSCTLVGSIENTFAQQTIEPETISVVQGLASPSVRDVIQDSYGLIWLSTANGIQMYDGETFKNYKHEAQDPNSLQTNSCWEILEDNDHNIWVGNEFGISRFDRKTRQFTNYNFSKKYFSSTSNDGLVLHLYLDPEGKIWAGSVQLGVLYFDPSTNDWKKVRAEHDGKIIQGVDLSTSLAITTDVKGNKWIGNAREGLLFSSASDSIFHPVVIGNQDSSFFKTAGNLITALYADTTNIIWITTRIGVFKYDPESNTLKTIIAYDPNFEFFNSWNQIKPDNQGNVWITNNVREILKFDGISDSYQIIRIKGKDAFLRTDFSEVFAMNFYQDRSGIIWMGTWQSGLLKYNPISKPFRFYRPVASDSLFPFVGSVYSLIESSFHPNRIFVSGSSGGLLEFNSENQTFTSIPFKSRQDTKNGIVRGILEERDGTLWLGTWGEGLIKMDANHQEIKRFTTIDSVENPIVGNSIRVIKKDPKGNLWIGTTTGLAIFNPGTESFRQVSDQSSRGYTKNSTDQLNRLLKTDQVVGLIDKVTDYKNDSTTITITTPGKYLAASVGEGGSYMVDYGWIENQRGDTIWTSRKYSDSYYAGGALKNRIHLGWINLEKGKYTLHYITDDSHSFGKWNDRAPKVTSLYGLAVILPKDSATVRSINARLKNRANSQTLSDIFISDIDFDQKYAWISTQNGLNRLDLASDSIRFFKNEVDNENSLINNSIAGMYLDSDSAIWLATDGGLDRFNPITNSFTHFTEDDGLPTNYISDIVPGDKGELWISTQNGLSQMVQTAGIDKPTFVNYNASDGLGNVGFSPNSALRTSEGKYYFGGNKGITQFEKVVANQEPPQMILTDFLIGNKSVTAMGAESPLTNALIATKDIHLAYDQNALSFEFAALHYSNPTKNQYAHKLVGYDKDWIYDNRNYAAYTNLDPGEYDFKIRGSNAFGVWNTEGLTIHISIASPWWRTWWAYAVYAILFLSLIFVVDRVMRQRIATREREKNRDKELAQAKEIEKAYHNLEEAHKDLKSAQTQLVEQEKLASLGQLTAGIAHEIKNPLNFVVNFSDLSNELIDEVLDEFQKKNGEANKEEIEANLKDVKSNLLKINQHGTRADGIVKSMLQHSRGGNGEKAPTDLNGLVREYANLAFHGMRAGKNPINVKMDFELDENLGQVNLISDDFSRVVLNLCNNAFDAMREKANALNAKNPGDDYNPTLRLKTIRKGDSVELSVSDNGPGIPEEIRNKILQPFFTTKKGTDGTGLGLSITNDIITAHGGDLKIDSDIGSGTRFTITLTAQ